MDKYLKNFFDLYSNDDEVVQKAIFAKKSWILSIFVTPITFSYIEKDNKKIYEELYSLMDQAFLFSFDKEKKYVYKKWLDEVNLKPLHHAFYAELDFNRLDHDTYCELFANFYPCLNKEDIKSIKDPFLYKLASLMNGKENEYVLLLDYAKSFKGKVYLPYVSKLIAYKDYLNEEEIDMIIDIKEHLNIDVDWR